MLSIIREVCCESVFLVLAFGITHCCVFDFVFVPLFILIVRVIIWDQQQTLCVHCNYLCTIVCMCPTAVCVGVRTMHVHGVASLLAKIGKQRLFLLVFLIVLDASAGGSRCWACGVLSCLGDMKW